MAQAPTAGVGCGRIKSSGSAQAADHFVGHAAQESSADRSPAVGGHDDQLGPDRLSPLVEGVDNQPVDHGAAPPGRRVLALAGSHLFEIALLCGTKIGRRARIERRPGIGWRFQRVQTVYSGELQRGMRAEGNLAGPGQGLFGQGRAVERHQQGAKHRGTLPSARAGSLRRLDLGTLPSDCGSRGRTADVVDGTHDTRLGVVPQRKTAVLEDPQHPPVERLGLR